MPKPKKKKNVVTVKVDLDEIREYARKMSKDNDGLESSSGYTPHELDRVWDSINLPKSADKFSGVVASIIQILVEAHDEHAKDDF